jgi:hypothetical protein
MTLPAVQPEAAARGRRAARRPSRRHVIRPGGWQAGPKLSLWRCLAGCGHSGWRRLRQGQCAARLVAAHVQAERRVLVGHQARARGDPQHPPVHAEDEVEDLPGVPPGHHEDHFALVIGDLGPWAAMFHLTVRNRPLDSGWARVADLYADHLRWLCPMNRTDLVIV